MNEQPLTVIAIDDDQADLRVLRRMLERVGTWPVQFEGYTDSKSGVSALKAGHGDIVFLDYLLGGITGLSVLKTMRRANDTRPVIVLTGHGDEYVAAELMRNGANGYVAKHDLNPHMLRLAIESALRERTLAKKNLELRQQLEAARKLEAIGTLAGGLAHDFNNILTGIIGTVELSLMKDPDPRFTTQLETIRSECYRMNQLIRRLLNFSEGEETAATTVDVVQTLNDCLARFRETLPPGIRLDVKMPDDPIAVHGTRSGLDQIITNLCTNARDAVAHDGRITIRVRRLTPDAERPRDREDLSHKEYALIEVEDDGHGMTPDVRQRIFDPFFTTKALGADKGTGLGLATVWQIVRQFNGNVNCYSEPKNGTTFRVYIPSSATPAAQHDDTFPESAASSGGERVLVVDDEPLILRVVSRMLGRLGYGTAAAESGEDALKMLQSEPGAFRLVIMDMTMPGLSGLECLRELRNSHPDLPVLMSSGHNLESRVEELTDAGAQGFIQKPYHLDELAREVRRLLDVAHSA